MKNKELDKIKKEISKHQNIISKSKDRIKELENKKKDIQIEILKIKAKDNGLTFDELLNVIATSDFSKKGDDNI